MNAIHAGNQSPESPFATGQHTEPFFRKPATRLVLLLAATLLCFPASAQPVPLEDDPYTFPFTRHQPNEIAQVQALDSFYAKLYRLRQSGEGRVNIVHIGDSHLQAGLLTAPLRKQLQALFGNAGRGLVFPYQLARSNAPPDLLASSNVGWQYNRLAHPEMALASGVAGFCIQSSAPGALIRMALKPDPDTAQTFSSIRLFTGNDAGSGWLIQAENNDTGYGTGPGATDSLAWHEITLDHPASSFTLFPSGSLHRFYGASLENSQSGVLYHTIGVNGATFGQYNKAALFWQQLAALRADLYIVSLGTNEAQRKIIDTEALSAEMLAFVDNLKTASPGAAVLITSPADSYFGGRSLSPSMKAVSSAFADFCLRGQGAFWDLYNITGGYGSARSWERYRLMSHDRIHYIKPGYELQGNLLFHTLMSGYNLFAGRYQYNPFNQLEHPAKTADK